MGDVEEEVFRNFVDSLAQDWRNHHKERELSHFLLLVTKLGLDKSLVRNNHIAELLIDLDNLELHGLAYEYIVVAYWMNVNLATGQECFDSEYINNHTTLSAALDVALNNLVVSESLVNTVPALGQACLLVRQNQLALLVLLVLNVNFNLVTYLEVGVVAEFRSRNDTIALVTDVNDNLFLVSRDYGTFYYLMLRLSIE